LAHNSYNSAAKELLSIGDIRGSSTWLDYSSYGITSKDIPELIKMATDDKLNFAGSNSTYVWAPLHAWRALGQLRAIQAIDPLISLFEILENDDWAHEDLPKIFGMLGKVAIPNLSRYLSDTSHRVMSKIICANCIQHIGMNDDKSKRLCIQVLSKALEDYLRNDPSLNAFYIWYLKDLGAKDKLPLIQKAYKKGKVDEKVIGSFEKVESDFYYL
jgi:hypothetical protein